MLQASCSADKEPGRTWPIAAPLLLLDRPRKGLVPRSSMNLQIQPCQPLDIPNALKHNVQYEQAKSSRTSGDHPGSGGRQ